jgi:predicted RNA binding protein with dsRBD fold (UPF0201 family)
LRPGPQKTFVGFARPSEKIKGGAANRDGVLRVRVEAPCRPTETPDAVSRALRNLFPDLRLESLEGRVVGTTESLERLRQRIRDQRIRDTARRQLRAGRQGDRTTVSLSKQAAFVGVVNFAAGSPLGDIVVEIESDALDAVIDDVAESTVGRGT